MVVLPKAAILGAIGAVVAPHVLHGQRGMVGALVHTGTIHPAAGTFGYAVSIPIFLAVTVIGWLLLRAGTAR
jgi:hypothetical protein